MRCSPRRRSPDRKSRDFPLTVVRAVLACVCLIGNGRATLKNNGLARAFRAVSRVRWPLRSCRLPAAWHGGQHGSPSPGWFARSCAGCAQRPRHDSITSRQQRRGGASSGHVRGRRRVNKHRDHRRAMVSAQAASHGGCRGRSRQPLRTTGSGSGGEIELGRVGAETDRRGDRTSLRLAPCGMTGRALAERGMTGLW